MRKIKLMFFVITGLLASINGFAQSISTELTGMTENWAIAATFKIDLAENSRFSFSNVNRFSSPYSDPGDFRLLLINSFGYSLTKTLKPTVGAIYVHGGDLKPSIGLQYFIDKEKSLLMIYPNFNLGHQTDFMLLSMFQYTTPLNPKVKLILRIQSLILLNKGGHLFSTVRGRVGLGKNKYQAGFASDFNFADREFEFTPNFGVFLKRDF